LFIFCIFSSFLYRKIIFLNLYSIKHGIWVYYIFFLFFFNIFLDISYSKKKMFDDQSQHEAFYYFDGGKSGTKMEKETKATLYTKAQKYKIVGRSKMTKAQLISALRQKYKEYSDKLQGKGKKGSK